jgi:hypothetical protein
VDTRADQGLDESGCGRAVLAGPARGKKDQSRRLAFLTERFGELGNSRQIEAALRFLEGQDRGALDDITVAGEVKRLEWPVLCDALSEKLDSARDFVASRIAASSCSKFRMLCPSTSAAMKSSAKSR